MAFSKNIGDLIGGISQQPFTQRKDNQSEDQENCINSSDDGLSNRSGSYISNHYSDLTEIKAFNPIDIKKLFMLYDQNQELRVFGDRNSTVKIQSPYLLNDINFGMQEKTVSYESPTVETNFKAYMGLNPNAGFLNINDATYIYNKNIEVETQVAGGGNLINLNFVEITEFNQNSNYNFYGKVEGTANGIGYRTFSYAALDEQGYTTDIGQNRKDATQLARFLASSQNSNFRYGTSQLRGMWFKPNQMTINLTDGDGVNLIASTQDNEYEINGFIYKPQADEFVEHSLSITLPNGVNQLVIPAQTIDDETTDLFGAITSIKRISTQAGSGAKASSTFDADFSYQVAIDTLGNPVYAFGTNTFTYYGARLKDGFNIGTQVNITIPTNNIMACYYSSGSTVTSIGDFFTDAIPYEDIVKVDSYDKINVIRPEQELISDLPPAFFNGSIVKITSGTSTDDDDYYVIFNTYSGAGFGSGEWVETVDPNTTQLDLTTMPYTAIFDEFGNCTIYDGGWKSRIVGDETTNQDPYFVGKKINELFIFENRLGVLSGGDKITLSGSGDLFNFYRTTVTQILASDRIDFIVTSDKLVNFKYAVPFNKAIMLIDDGAQYVMSYQGGLSIDTLSVQEVATYNTKLNIKPIKTNNSMFFVSNYGKNTQLIKFFNKDIQLVDGENVTERVESLLPNSITNADVTSSNDMLVLNKKEDNVIYVFNYKTLADNSQFNNWTKFRFENFNIEKLAVFEEVLYLFGKYNGSNEISMLNVDLGKDNSYEVMNDNYNIQKFRVGVDNKQLIELTDINNVSENWGCDTNIPFGNFDIENYRVIVGEDDPTKYHSYGYNIEVVNVVDNGSGYSRIIFKNPYHEKTDIKYKVDKIIAGTLMNSFYEFSRFNLRDRNGESINTGNTQLLSINITHSATGGYIINTDITNSGSYDEVFTGRIVGGVGSILGEIFLDKGDFNTWIGADKNEVKIKIKNLDYLPFNLQHAEYEVEYSARAGRL